MQTMRESRRHGGEASLRAPRPEECAGYIAEMAHELAGMARRARLDGLAATLAEAAAEAMRASAGGAR